MSTTTRALIFIMLLSLATSAGAQTHRASVRGTVSDPNGAVIPGTTVKAVNVDTNEIRATVTNEEGSYTISSLPAGNYRVEMERPGFARHLFTQVILQVNQELRLDAQLAVGTVQDSPGDLYGAEPLLKQDSSSIGTVIENRQIEGLPLDGRNFFELSLLVPGAVPAAPGSAGSVRGR